MTLNNLVGKNLEKYRSLRCNKGLEFTAAERNITDSKLLRSAPKIVSMLLTRLSCKIANAALQANGYRTLTSARPPSNNDSTINKNARNR